MKIESIKLTCVSKRGGGYAILQVPEATIIADVTPQANTVETMRVASLLAAAPDLLRVVQAFVNYDNNSAADDIAMMLDYAEVKERAVLALRLVGAQ